MAYNIVQQPQEYTPAYNDIPFRLFSDNVVLPRFMFCVDLYMIDPNSGLNEYLGRFRTIYQVNRSNLQLEGFFNLKDVFKNTYSLTTYPENQYQNRAFYIRADLGEEYAASATGTVTYYPRATADFVVYNGALDAQEFRLYDYTDYINLTTIAASSGVAINALTSLPFPRVIMRTTAAELVFLINGNSMNALFTYYNGNTSIGTQTVTVATSQRKITTVKISVNDLSIPDLATRFTVVLRRTSNGNVISPVYEYIFDTSCDTYEKVNVYWQNKFGAEDSFVFNMKSFRNSDTERNRFETIYGLNNGYDRAGTGVYKSTTRIKHRLNTDWLTQEQANALGQLAESNNVFISFDKELTLTPGTKASLRIQWPFEPGGSPGSDAEIELENQIASFFANTTLATYPATAIEYVTDYIIPSLIAAGLDVYYDFDTSLTDQDPIVVLVAKVTGEAQTLTVINESGGVTTSNNVPGVNDSYDLPQRIPVIVDNTTYDYKKTENEPLFQFELNVTERLSYERQTQ